MMGAIATTLRAVLTICLALKARTISSLGQRPRLGVPRYDLALKARFKPMADNRRRSLGRAFSANDFLVTFSWGAAPGCKWYAPSALNIEIS
jgi:hypothetical protein